MDVIHGNISDINSMDKRSKCSGIDFKRHFTLVIRPDLGERDTAGRQGGVTRFVKSLRSSIENVETYFEVECIDCWLNNCAAVVVILKGYCAQLNNSQKLKEFCRRCARTLSEITKVPFVIGISKVYRGINQVSVSYEEAFSALNCSFFSTDTCIFYAGNKGNDGVIDEYAIMKKINNLYKKLKSEEEGIEELGEIFDEINKTHFIEADYVRTLFVDICTITSQILYEKSGNTVVPEKDISEYRREIGTLKNIDDAYKYMKRYIKSVGRKINTVKSNRFGIPVRTVINYINDNYWREISLREAADLVSLSPGYLCSLIKKDTGESFTAVVNKIRVGKAKKLLKETNLKIFEVAGKVGINNYAYFYQIFKKIIGVSPVEFKNNKIYRQSGV